MTDNQPLVTIIIPCYNTERFVVETIESCLKSSYQNLEILVIDDGSTDNSAQLIKNIANKNPTVQYIYQKNKGLSSARNTGIDSAKGDFLMFLDADDLIYQNKIKIQVDFLQKNPKYDLLASGFARTDERGKLLYDSPAKEKQIDLSDMVTSSQFPVHTALIRKAAIKNTGYFDTSLRAAEDWDYWCRMLIKGHQMYRLAQPLCTYRLLDNAMTANAPRQTEMLLRVTEKTFSNPDLPKNLSVLQDAAKKQVLLNGTARCFVLDFHEEGNAYLKQYQAANKEEDTAVLAKKMAAMMKHIHVKDIEGKAKKIASAIDTEKNIKNDILLNYYMIYTPNVSKNFALFLKKPFRVLGLLLETVKTKLS